MDIEEPPLGSDDEDDRPSAAARLFMMTPEIIRDILDSQFGPGGIFGPDDDDGPDPGNDGGFRGNDSDSNSSSDNDDGNNNSTSSSSDDDNDDDDNDTDNYFYHLDFHHCYHNPHHNNNHHDRNHGNFGHHAHHRRSSGEEDDFDFMETQFGNISSLHNEPHLHANLPFFITDNDAYNHNFGYRAHHRRFSGEEDDFDFMERQFGNNLSLYNKRHLHANLPVNPVQYHHMEDMSESFSKNNRRYENTMVPSSTSRPKISTSGINFPVNDKPTFSRRPRPDHNSFRRYHEEDNFTRGLKKVTTSTSTGVAALNVGGKSGATVGKVVKPIAYGLMAAEAGIAIADDIERGTTRNTVEKTANLAGTFAGSTAGATAGAAIGTAICPVVGTLIGGITGAIIGGEIGSKGAQKTTEFICDELDHDIEWRSCEQCGDRFKARMYRSENERRYCADCR